EVALGRRIGLEHLRRGGDLPLERPQELLLLCHVLLLIISSAGFLLPARACQGRRSILPRAYLQWVIRQHGGVLRYDSPLPHPGGGGAHRRFLGGRLDAWLSRLPAPALVITGLVIVAGLGWMDFITGPELTPLVFYLVP